MDCVVNKWTSFRQILYLVLLNVFIDVVSVLELDVHVLRPPHHLYSVPTLILPGLETLGSCLEISGSLKDAEIVAGGNRPGVRDALDLPFTCTLWPFNGF